MAEKKITIATLRKMLVQQTGMSESKVATFLDAFFPAIVIGLKEDSQVRLNGFGTFKMQTVKPRKSVNVKTGESIIIESYNKVTFAAEATVKQQANADFAHLEPIKIASENIGNNANDPIKKLGEQAEEIKDILAELGVASMNNNLLEETKIEEQITEEKSADTTDNKTIEEPKIEYEEEKKESIEVKVEDNVVANNKDTRTTDSFQPWKVASITILIFCLLLIGAYFFLKHQLVSWADNLLQTTTEIEYNISEEQLEDILSHPLNNEVITVEQNEQEKLTEQTDEQQNTENIVIDSQQTEVEVITADQQEHSHWFGQERHYNDFIKTETMTDGSRLTHLSRKYYGAPDFWVYIYEANRELIANPNVIPQGVALKIPVLPKQVIDKNNPEAMQQAHELHNQILGYK